jgi:hypothetical protein
MEEDKETKQGDDVVEGNRGIVIDDSPADEPLTSDEPIAVFNEEEGGFRYIEYEEDYCNGECPHGLCSTCK